MTHSELKPDRPRRVQQTLGDVEDRNEVIFRWDPHGKFLRFSEGNRLTRHLMPNYSKAKRAFENRKNGLDGILEPYQTLTISGTEADSKTVDRSRFEVIDFFGEVNREFRYVIDGGWVYPNMPASNQTDMVDWYVNLVEWLYDQKEIYGLDHVELIPLAKGLYRSHYEQAEETYRKLGVDRIGIYAAQTRRLKTIISRSEQAIDVFDPRGVLVIGRQSPTDVAQLPDRVDGVAGFWNWKQACDLTADGYSSEDLAIWYNKIKEALQKERTGRQIGLKSSYHQEVKADG